MRTSVWISSVVAMVWACSGAANAQEARTIYLQGGTGEHNAYAATVGVTLPWAPSWSWGLGSGVVRGQWDAYVSNWSSRPEDAARRNTVWLGVGPSVRWRGDGGKSPWFVEAGTGVSFANRYYRSGTDQFGSRYSFASHIGVGRNFGAQGEHELSLRVQHSSNAGLKEPNPGENFLLLRYAHAF